MITKMNENFFLGKKYIQKRPSKSPLKGDFGFSPFKGELERVFGEIEGVS